MCVIKRSLPSEKKSAIWQLFVTKSLMVLITQQNKKLVNLNHQSLLWKLQKASTKVKMVTLVTSYVKLVTSSYVQLFVGVNWPEHLWGKRNSQIRLDARTCGLAQVHV